MAISTSSAANMPDHPRSNLHYWHGNSNFGDALNPVLAPHVFGAALDDASSDDLLFIGTLIGREVPEGRTQSIVGAGAGYETGRISLAHRNIHCVRGPVTCRLLGIDESYAAIDPAILVSRYFPKPIATAQQRGVFIPHWRTHKVAGDFYGALAEEVGLDYVSPLQDIPLVLSKVAAAPFVLTEALHGAVVAEAYDVPWVPLTLYRNVLHDKWVDFCLSIGSTYRPVEPAIGVSYSGRVPMIDYLRHAAYRLGIGKKKYRYVPVRPINDARKEAILESVRAIIQDLDRYVCSCSILQKGRSVARLDDAINTFLHGR